MSNRHYLCHECREVTDGDEDGFCAKCGSDDVLSYTDEDAREMAGLASVREPAKGTK